MRQQGGEYRKELALIKADNKNRFNALTFMYGVKK